MPFKVCRVVEIIFWNILNQNYFKLKIIPILKPEIALNFKTPAI